MVTMHDSLQPQGPTLSIGDVPALATMEKPGQQQPGLCAIAARHDSGHPAFVTWDRDAEYKSELVQLKRWRTQYRRSKAYVKSGFGQVHGSDCCRCACAWHCMKLLAYQLLLPLNPEAAPVCSTAMGSAGNQRRPGSQTGLDLGSAREKIKELPATCYDCRRR